MITSCLKLLQVTIISFTTNLTNFVIDLFIVAANFVNKVLFRLLVWILIIYRLTISVRPTTVFLFLSLTRNQLSTKYNKKYLTKSW